MTFRLRNLVVSGLVLVGCVDTSGPEADTLNSSQNQTACGAASLQNLVGETLSNLDETRLPRPFRIILAGSSASGAAMPDRLTLVIGTDDRVSRVLCG